MELYRRLLMKKGLSAYTALVDSKNEAHEEKLISRISNALKEAGINVGYECLKVSQDDENKAQTNVTIISKNYNQSNFSFIIEKDNYSIEGVKPNHHSAMTSDQLKMVSGTTDDYNEFVGALEYILACHYPEAVKNGKLQTVMDKFKRPEPVSETVLMIGQGEEMVSHEEKPAILLLPQTTQRYNGPQG